MHTGKNAAMSSFPAEFKYSETHEWVQVDGKTATIGITDYAQEELGDIVYVDLKEAGTELKNEDEFGSIESVKAVSELFMPISGKILEVNEDIAENPTLVNEDPHYGGWLVKIQIENPKELSNLMTASEYAAFVEEEKEREREDEDEEEEPDEDEEEVEE